MWRRDAARDRGADAGGVVSSQENEDAREDAELAEKWLVEASQHRPKADAWAMLFAGLRLDDHRDQRRRQRQEQEELDPEQARQENLRFVAGSFTRVYEFLNQHQMFREESTQRALAMMAAALMDVAGGRSSDLFIPPKPRGRPKKPILETQVMGIAARALTELMEAGVSEDDAAAQVARAARAGRCSGYRKIDVKLVKGWRHRLNQGPAPGTPDMALARYKTPLPSIIANDANAKADFLLAILRKNTGLRSLSE